ncbi:hypothetical protein MKX03_028761, partial [Papaver bracteatum]
MSIPGAFKLHVMEGEFVNPHIVVMLDENGTGKSTFLHALYFPLLLLLEPCCVRNRITNSYKQPQFVSAVMEPLQVDKLMEKLVVELSPCIMYFPREGLHFALSQDTCYYYSRNTISHKSYCSADVYLIDEPSAYLDSQQCITALKVVKGFIHHGKKSAFGVEHDITMATYLAHRVIVFEGTPSVDCTANAPQTLLSGMNLSLSIIRQDPTNFRPWINKLGSNED